MSKTKHEEVTGDVKLRIYPKDTMFFRVVVGSAKEGDDEYELSTAVGSGAPMVRMPDGKTAVFPWKELIETAKQVTGKMKA